MVKSILKIRSGFIGPDEGGLLRGVDWLKSDQGKEVNLIKLNRQKTRKPSLIYKTASLPIHVVSLRKLRKSPRKREKKQ